MVLLTCPSCGNQIAQITKFPQVIVCPACNTTNFLQNGQLESVGKLAILTDMPSIFSINKTFRHKDWSFTPVGRVRYDYGGGWWDEWFVRSGGGKESWVSVDEGDIAIEVLFRKDIKIPAFETVLVGQELLIEKTRMTVVEKNKATLIGVEGELPFRIIPNEQYNYIDLLAPRAQSFTAEYHANGIECYKGTWVDPFEITAG